MEDKMKAPHPEGWTPHRGYSAAGREKAYTKEDMEAADEEHRRTMRKIVDWKVSKTQKARPQQHRILL